MATASSSGLSSVLPGGVDTIVARATPAGRGALAVIRVSGPETAAVAQRVCPEVDTGNGWRAGLATLLGTYTAMLLAMLGIALAPATVAAVLLSTTPIFALVVEAVVDGRRPNVAAVAGTTIAVSGVAILTVGG